MRIRHKNRAAAAVAGQTTYSTGVPCKHGHDSPRYTRCGACRQCKYDAEARRRDTPEGRAHLLWFSAKVRAAERGISFSIDPKDVVVPKFCPVFGLELKAGAGKVGDASPTLDRLSNKRGYEPGNVAVISYRANVVKNCGSVEEHRRVADWLERFPGPG